MSAARNIQIMYNVKVEYKPTTFVREMDFSISSAVEAYDHYKKMSEKYGENKVHITKITTTTTKERISGSKLLELTKD